MPRENEGIQLSSIESADRMLTPVGDSAVWRLGYAEDPVKPGFMHVRWGPGEGSPEHRHKSWTACVILKGPLRVGEKWHEAGDVLVIEPNIWYGPLEAGPEGAELLEIHATLVFTHRDPVAVIQSTITMQAYNQRTSRTRVARQELLDYWSDRVLHLLRGCVRDRELFPADGSVDSPFHVLMADPMAMIERVYAAARLPLTPAARAQLLRYIDEHPRGKEGQVIYDLCADFGIDPNQLRERYRFYLDRFGVRPEVK